MIYFYCLHFSFLFFIYFQWILIKIFFFWWTKDVIIFRNKRIWQIHRLLTLFKLFNIFYPCFCRIWSGITMTEYVIIINCSLEKFDFALKIHNKFFSYQLLFMNFYDDNSCKKYWSIIDMMIFVVIRNQNYYKDYIFLLPILIKILIFLKLLHEYIIYIFIL